MIFLFLLLLIAQVYSFQSYQYENSDETRTDDFYPFIYENDYFVKSCDFTEKGSEQELRV